MQYGTDDETSKKYELQHTNAFVSYNRENECLFGCKLSRTTCSVGEDKLVLPHCASRPSPTATRPSFKKGFLGPGSRRRVPGQKVRGIGLGWPPEVESYLTRLQLSNEKANLLPFWEFCRQ